TKLTNLELSSLETKHAENFRKLFMAMSRDVRVLLGKLAAKRIVISWMSKGLKNCLAVTL
ncbi:hypothetical protein, partial [Crocosphaera sp.]|uniref:hypothetical protein n=1 Tax=Crocosphaera sp. TaxID=2729996 RepID=UPI00257D17B0